MVTQKLSFYEPAGIEDTIEVDKKRPENSIAEIFFTTLKELCVDGEMTKCNDSFKAIGKKHLQTSLLAVARFLCQAEKTTRVKSNILHSAFEILRSLYGIPIAAIDTSSGAWKMVIGGKENPSEKELLDRVYILGQFLGMKDPALFKLPATPSLEREFDDEFVKAVRKSIENEVERLKSLTEGRNIIGKIGEKISQDDPHPFLAKGQNFDHMRRAVMDEFLEHTGNHELQKFRHVLSAFDLLMSLEQKLIEKSNEVKRAIGRVGIEIQSISRKIKPSDVNPISTNDKRKAKRVTNRKNRISREDNSLIDKEDTCTQLISDLEDLKAQIETVKLNMMEFSGYTGELLLEHLRHKVFGESVSITSAFYIRYNRTMALALPTREEFKSAIQLVLFTIANTIYSYTEHDRALSSYKRFLQEWEDLRNQASRLVKESHSTNNLEGLEKIRLRLISIETEITGVKNKLETSMNMLESISKDKLVADLRGTVLLPGT